MKQIPVLSEPMCATPIYELNHEYTQNQIFIKRDDFVPFSFGGNKARKARFFYQDIVKKQPDILVTYGSSSSNHCRIIANMAAALGIACHIISPEEQYKQTANSRLISLFDATIEICPVNQVSEAIDKRLALLRQEGNRPYFIMGGGHGNLGTAAYVEAYNEILQYEEESGVYFDYLFHASGTGTTQAGLICGQILSKDFHKGTKRAEHETQKIVGISIARSYDRGYSVIEESIRQYLEECQNMKYKDITNHLIFEDTYRKGGYGEYDQRVLETIDDVMKYEGIPMDTTYVGKAFCGMNEYLKEKRVVGKKVLFIHTGGTPLFFDNQKRKAKE